MFTLFSHPTQLRRLSDMSTTPPDDLYFHIQGLNQSGGGIYDEVEDVRALLDGLGDAIQQSPPNKVQTKPSSSLHRNPEFASVRNLRN